MNELEKQVSKWRNRIGLFISLTYESEKGKLLPARGRLDDITSNGMLSISDLSNPNKQWDIHIDTIKSSTCEPIKGDRNENFY